MSTSVTGAMLTVDKANKGKEFNEFAKIPGLEPAVLRWLREVFQVFTLADLANLSVKRVFSQAQDEGQPIARNQIEDWIMQAQRFAAEQTTWQTFATFVVSLQTRQVGGQTEQRTIAYFVEADRRKIWSGIECNGVYELMLDQLKQAFQLEPEVTVSMASETKIESELIAESESKPTASQLDLATPATNTELTEAREPVPIVESQVAPESMPQREEILVNQPEKETQLASRSKPESEDQLASTTESLAALKADVQPEATVVDLPTTIKIMQLKLLQPPQKEMPITIDSVKQPLSLSRGQTFGLEVTFQLTGAGAIALTEKPLSYHAECYLQNRATGEKSQLSSTPVSTVAEGELTYTSLLEAVLKEPGVYRLQVIMQTDGGYASPDFFELPFVHVV